jgi:hypothetical protein
MRSTVWCFSLLVLFFAASAGSDAIAESMQAIEGPFTLPAEDSSNGDTRQQADASNATIFASTFKASTEIHRDSGAVTQAKSSQDSSPNTPRASFWQWLSGRTVDCSSGACTFK